MTDRSLDSAPSEILSSDSSSIPSDGDVVRISQEYAQAFRTKSYVEMWNQLVETRIDLPVLPRAHLSASLLQPRSETLLEMAESLEMHPLLINYFDLTLNACDVYESLLQDVHRARADFRKIDDAISKLAEEGLGNRAEKMCGKLRRELLEHARIENPLSVVSMDKFRNLHDGYVVLLHDLLLEHRQMNWRTKLSKGFWKIAKCIRIWLRSNEMMCSHSHGSGRKIQDPLNTRLPPLQPPLSSLGEAFDVAAKVLYIQTNDMDTVSRLVGRLQDDASHWKSRATMAVGCTDGELWKGIIKGLSNHGRCFMERLDELEERICLCLLNINKSRMSVVHEIVNNMN